ncbi:MAG: hypothetical protein SFY81_07240 [Verrucomicrobiota bacterium]|nr:hypothetical protein [Verrucomicrobiota bacterium]
MAMLLSLRAVIAQVTVEVLFDEQQYLPSETLTAKVRISNSSGKTLTFGREENWLLINVEGSDGYIVPQIKSIPVVGEFSLESSQVGTKRIDLAPYFELSKIGRYRATAVVRVPGFEGQFEGRSKPFDISSGSTIWETTFGVPEENGEGKSTEMRKYLLVQANQGKQIKLYVRVTDQAETHNIRVFPLGPVISFSRPEPQVDRWSNLHVLQQTGARTFSYYMITPDGFLLARETHEYAPDSRPVLKADVSGKISVKGGTRRYASSDLPPDFPKDRESDEPSDAKKTSP